MWLRQLGQTRVGWGGYKSLVGNRLRAVELDFFAIFAPSWLIQIRFTAKARRARKRKFIVFLAIFLAVMAAWRFNLFFI
jgi:hypothetical protein